MVHPTNNIHAASTATLTISPSSKISDLVKNGQNKQGSLLSRRLKIQMRILSLHLSTLPYIGTARDLGEEATSIKVRSPVLIRSK